MPTIQDHDVTWLNTATVSYDGSELRRIDGALFATNSAGDPLSGVVRGGSVPLGVTCSSADVVTVQRGAYVIANLGGVYRGVLAGATTKTLDARNATNPRVDLVVARVLDTSVVPAHAAYTGRIEIITGDPAAAPVAPALPAMAIELGRISVPAQGGGAPSTDTSGVPFTTINGGEHLAPTLARLPAGVPVGTRGYVTGTKTPYRYESSSAGWVPEQTQPVAVTAARTLALSVSSGVITQVQMSTIEVNKGWGNLNSGGLLIPETGLYQVNAQITSSSSSSTGLRMALIYVNGSEVCRDVASGLSASGSTPSINRALYLYSGDLVDLRFYQTSGATMSTGTGVGRPILQLYKIAGS